MPDYELIQERIISGTGVLRVPRNKQDNRHSVLYLDVIRPPRNRYLNKNWNPSKGKYAYITYLRNDYVIGNADMEFEKYAIDSIADIAGQTLIALKCFVEATANAFQLLGNALGAPIGVNPNLIKDYENLDLLWDEIRIKCYADTAIQARLYRLKYDSCREDYDRRRRPPPPPPPRPPLPPGTPIGDISPPYEPDEDDPYEDNYTDPYEGDETAATIWAVDTVYVQSSDCSQPRLNITFYFSRRPTFTVVPGFVTCGADRYLFNVVPGLVRVDGGELISPVPYALYALSNYDSIGEPYETEQPA